MLRVSILDGYVDEPTCLGVPPYISPYPRYIAGAVWDYDSRAAVSYFTIDQVRNDSSLVKNLAAADVLVVIAGMSVPGRYLSGFPVSPSELIALCHPLSRPVKLLCGPAARHGFGMAGGRSVTQTDVVKQVFDLIVPGDGEVVLTALLRNKLNPESLDVNQCRADPSDIRTYATKGARIVQNHPFYPDCLITELETYRGCSRSITGGCSFCSEPQKGLPQFRAVEDICAEVEALYTAGVRHFRLGSQPCLFSYMAHGVGDQEFPVPNPDAVERLFKGIRSVAPHLWTLHIDNANPGVLAAYPDECRQIAHTIVKYHTPGDVAALGVESVDPVVISKNNLKASAEDVLDAVRLLNEVGATRGVNGLPELLPGLNFIAGLSGETKHTFTLNYEFLRTIAEEGLLLRRINLRQVIPIPGTPMFESGNTTIRKHKAEFQRFKRHVRETLEQPLLKRLVPQGTLLTDVCTETYEGKLTFGRQLGSYPLLIGIPGIFPLHTFFNVKVIDYGYRSITALPYPLDVNTAARETLEALPGIGRKRALRLLLHRPFHTIGDLQRALDDPQLADTLTDYLGLK
ncbi:MAG: radical SAM protein [Candidatus Thermoplasmatota archaeon]|nr:radical SAM protein [Candidatus Thermoplasmatota archaeon]